VANSRLPPAVTPHTLHTTRGREFKGVEVQSVVSCVQCIVCRMKRVVCSV
jgi:hypothetical protein